MERVDALISAIAGVVRVDVWPDRVKVVFSGVGVPDKVVDALKSVAAGRVEIIGGSMTAEVAGMTCRGCEISLERQLGSVPAVERASADSSRGRVSVSFGASAAPKWSALAEAVRGAGYSLREADAATDDRIKFSAPQVIGFLAAAFGAAWLMSASSLSHLAFTGDGSMNFGVAVILGLLAGFSSCMAVAGGLMLTVVAKLGGRFGNSGLGRLTPTLMFIVGRLASYALLGAVIGWLGRLVAPSVSVSGAIIIAAAALMMLAGLESLGLLPRFLRRLVPAIPKMFGRRAAGVADSGSIAAPFALGVATFFLPCGFTQSLQLYALTVKSPVAGAAVLGGFALGTAPALLALGWAAGWFRGRVRRMFLGFSGAVLIALAAVNLVSGMAVLGITPPWRSVGVDMSEAAEGLPPISDGRQVIRMTVGAGDSAYSPDSFTVRAGIPVRWEIDQKSSSGCLSYVVSRQLDINEPLKIGLNVVNFTPRKAGSYVFSCSMGMYTGTITVLPAS